MSVVHGKVACICICIDIGIGIDIGIRIRSSFDISSPWEGSFAGRLLQDKV